MAKLIPRVIKVESSRAQHFS